MDTPAFFDPPTDTLFDFAWFPGRGQDVPASKGFDSRLGELALRAQKENWSFDTDQPYGMLNSYLRYTFKRLANQKGKILRSADSGGTHVALFNTGLFTPNYEVIFAFFEGNLNSSRQPWVFKDWVVESDRRIAFFKTKPAPARYFEKPGDLVYDPDRELIPNLDHILDENADRYPHDLRDNPHRRRMMLQGAIAEAAKRAQMNYKVAVPQFFFGRDDHTGGHIQLLLPLYLNQPDRADLALVVEPDWTAYAYRAFTVLPLDRAYSNARLIAKPETDWLKAPDAAVAWLQPGGPEKGAL